MSASYPRDWHETTIGDVFDRMSKSIDVDPKSTYQEIGIRSHGKGIFAKKPVSGVSLGEKRVFAVEPECLILNIVFAWEQAVAKTTSSEVGKVVSHRFPMYRPKPGRIDVDYALYFFKSKWGKNLLEIASPGGAGRNKTLNQSDFADLPLVLPPLEQQRRIVAVLSAWDRAIDYTEGLIAAKRQRKNYLLGLLFGVERNALKTKGVALGDLASVHYGKALSADRYVSDGTVKVFGTQGVIGQTENRLFEGPAIVVGRKGTLDKPVLVAAGEPFWSIDTTFVVRAKTSPKIIHSFLKYIDLTMLSETSGIPSLSSDNLSSLCIPSSAFNDVEAAESLITIVDSDIDGEIELLSSLRTQKRSLSQKLLSGERQLSDRFDDVLHESAAVAGASA